MQPAARINNNNNFFKNYFITLRNLTFILLLYENVQQQRGLIIIIAAFKGVIRGFLQSPHSPANCLQHVRSSGPGATVCKPRATHWALVACKMSCYVPLGTKGQLSHYVWQSEGGEETGVPRENPWRLASENATFYSPKIQAPSETRTRAVALVAG